MGDTNGRLDSPMGKSNDSSRTVKSDTLRSDSASPLLDTEPLPIDDHSHCPYCRKDFRKPRVLDCLHSMCEDCIIAQLDGRPQKAREQLGGDPTDCELEAPKVRERPTPPGVIRCPICQQESHVGNDVRYVHSMLLDYVRLMTADEVRGERPCRACKSEMAAIAFCKQCQSDLCSNCLIAHGVMRMFDGHEALTYTELDSLGVRSDVRPVTCSQHNLPFKMLCATCEVLACKSCLDSEHLSHKVLEVNDLVVSTIQKEVIQLSDRVEKKWAESMKEWEAIPDRAAMLHEQFDTAKARVEMNFEELAKALEEMKARKLSDLDDARQKLEHGIEDLYTKMSVNESRVGDALRFTRELIDKSNGMELIASRRKVVQQLNTLQHTMPALGIQVELEFQPFPKKQLEAQLSTICGSVDGRMVSASVKDLSTDMQRVSHDGDWSRLNGANLGPVGAIGAERKKTTGTRGSTDVYASGWPPSSNPPDGAPSPPTRETIAPIPSGPPGAPLPNPVSSASTLASIYNNYQWSGASTPAPFAGGSAAAQAFQAAQMARGVIGLPGTAEEAKLQQQLKIAQAAMFLQNNGIVPNNPQMLLAQQQAQQARLGLPRGVDPLSLGLGLGNLSLGGDAVATTMAAGIPPSLALGTHRASPQQMDLPNNGRLNELKIHSVFGTSSQGSTIRELHCPSGFCLSENDDILIADTNNHRVVVCGPPHPWKIGRPGTDDGQLCFPRKVVALRGEQTRFVVLDKGVDGKTRAQMFDIRGEFIKKIYLVALVPRGGIEVSAATCTPQGHLLLVDTTAVVYCIDVDQSRVLYWFDASAHLGEASDVAVYEKQVYVTDFKHHCVQVFRQPDGQFVRKLGEPSQTPYPIGIDVSKHGEILVADTHGNHLHVVVFGPDGHLQQSFTHNEFRLSRCVGLRVAGSGHVVTLCKHNHTLFVFKPLFIGTRS